MNKKHPLMVFVAEHRNGVIKFVLILIALIGLYRFILLPLLRSPEFILFIENIGWLGYVIIIFYIVLSHVLAPISGTPGALLGIVLYGLPTGLFILYIANLISAVVNFYISRIYGRTWVERFAGKSSMKSIDDFVSVEGTKTLILARFIGIALFDVVSYAVGLTNMSFKKYMVITAITAAINSFVLYFVFMNIDMGSNFGISMWITFALVASLLFGLIFRHYVKQSQKKQKNKEES